MSAMISYDVKYFGILSEHTMFNKNLHKSEPHKDSFPIEENICATSYFLKQK